MVDTKVSPGISVLSSDPAYVTGGTVLIAVEVPTGADPSTVRVTLGDKDVSQRLSFHRASRSLRGLVDGLSIGENVLEARHINVAIASLVITNHPIEGPIFSGPHLRPWHCTVREVGLGEPIDDQCNAPCRYDFFYMSKGFAEFRPYEPANPPERADIATTTTDGGVTRQYVVRRETGAIDRSIYQIAVLFDPNKPWSPFEPQAAWNHKVYLPLEGGLGKSFSQSFLMATIPQEMVLNDMALRRGFMVAKTSFLQPPTNMDWVRGAESLLMLKERIIKDYGSIRYTFASGASGGSNMQTLIVNSYPGLLQGIIPMAQFIDLWGGISQEVHDCMLLRRYFIETSPALWQDADERIAVGGYLDETPVNFIADFFVAALGLMDPSRGGALAPPEFLPAAAVMYHPTTNPSGARGTQQDYQVNCVGRRSEDQWTPSERLAGFGFARSVHDNVGVQYGLQALVEGSISAEQFVDLNAKIGGVDIDFNPVEMRTEQDAGVAGDMFRMGFINDAQNLDKVAIISPRLPDIDPIATHTIVHSVIYRERLAKAHGSAENHVLWIIPATTRRASTSFHS
jgi:hypothetical protein